MLINTYKGLEKIVFSTIGKYAMNANIIKKLGNPITTDAESKWIIGYDELDSVAGFCRLNTSKTRNKISNIFIVSGNQFDFDLIISAAIKTCDNSLEILSYADNDNLVYFEDLGFEINKKGLNWHTVLKQNKQ